jgi:hypothetical protein
VTTSPPPDTPPSRRFTIIFTAAMIVIAIGWSWVWHMKTARLRVESAPPVAVAGVLAPADSTDAAVGDLLAIGLARVRGLTLIPSDSLYARTAGDATPAALVTAARAAGAAQVIQLELSADGTGYALASRRLDAGTADRLFALMTRGRTVIDAVDAMVAHIAMSYGLAVPDGSVADVTTASYDAFTAYAAAARALHAADTATARTRLHDALRADPGFGSARTLLQQLDGQLPSQ